MAGAEAAYRSRLMVDNDMNSICVLMPRCFDPQDSIKLFTTATSQWARA